jgi:hypothetical protein
MVEILFYGSADTQSAASYCKALVVQELVPRLARPAPLSGMHQNVKPA